MASANHGSVVRSIDRVFNHGCATGISEGQLLRQFATSGDESAFEALVTRHGPMVLGVCRRLLFDPRDVEDAFQATFLVLLRRAGSLRDADPLGPWLHGVAYRVAARIRARSARRPGEERKGARPEAVSSASDIERHELRGILDEEIGRLPETYRRPIVLCYLEGQTHEQAARRLRCTEGSIRGRLDRAREKLKARLSRRGVTPSAGLIASDLAGDMATAAVPTSWVAGTVATLGRAATARAVATTVSASVVELADGVFRAMILARLKVASAFLAAGAVVLAVGAVLSTTLSYSLARDGQDLKTTVQSKDQHAAARPETSSAVRPVGSIDFRVVEKRGGKPMAGVALVIQADGKNTGRTTTDESGRAAIPIPTPPPNFMDVVVRKPGFAPMRTYMRRPTVAEDIPASYTLAMVPIRTVRGVVRDEQGQPIEGVEVKPMIWTRSSANAPTNREEFVDPVSVRTDGQGRWRWESLPTEIEPARVTFQFTHPDFQRVDLSSDKTAELIRREGVTVLPRGVDLAGRVVDAAGRPIRGASILLSPMHRSDGDPLVRTDADGRFRFAHIKPRAANLTVQARGHAPDMREVDLRQGLPPVEIRLEKGRTIRGHVVDRRGVPLAAAIVDVDAWRKDHTLGWRAQTDEEGEFRWENAPPDAVSINVFLQGYLSVRGLEIAPAADAVAITLIGQLKVRGTVVDAETRHGIPSFLLVPGMESGKGASTYWERNRSRTMGRGRFEIRFDDAFRKDGRRIRIEADGYMPGVSRVIHDDEDEPVVNFVLHKDAGISGIVHLANGVPLAEADVVLVSPSQPAFINNGRPPESVQHRVVKTGAEGRFAFPSQEPPFTIVALHDRGFAQQTIDTSPPSAFNLTTRPWGRVEGTLRIGNRPGAGLPVSLSYMGHGDTPRTIPWWSGEERTDAEGRFVFERVMPGAVDVARDIVVVTSPSIQTIYRSPSTRVDVPADKTTRLTLGGMGRPIVGKLTAPAEIAAKVDWIQSENLMIAKPGAVRSPAVTMRKLSETRSAPSSYAVLLDKDGSFRVEDVEAGTYDLIFVVNEPSRDPRGFVRSHAPLGSARREVIVRVMADGRSDQPLDLGTIPLEPLQKR